MKNLSMILFLPTELDGLNDFEATLSYEKVEKWIESLMNQRREQTVVKLPKFKFTSKFSLKDSLMALGMKTAFSAKNADFSGMTGNKELFIGDVIHKAFIDLHEKGTEAAAATAVVMLKAMYNPDKSEFIADHPFLYLIRDNNTGSILFMGRVVNP